MTELLKTEQSAENFRPKEQKKITDTYSTKRFHASAFCEKFI